MLFGVEVAMRQEQMENKIQLDTPGYSVYTNTRCMGRPPKPEHLRRSKLFPLRLTPGEIARYERAARKLGVTVAEMLRQGADLYIQTRGRDGSPKKETKK
jgi:hypothetical protein